MKTYRKFAASAIAARHSCSNHQRETVRDLNREGGVERGEGVNAWDGRHAAVYALGWGSESATEAEGNDDHANPKDVDHHEQGT
jgi:hypothetical protein